MVIWSSEIKELKRLYESLKGQLPDLEKELERLIKADDENMILLYSRRCLEVIITDLCECELKRPRKTEPLKGIIDKLHKEDKVPSNIITSMDHLNSLSAYGAHPKDFDPEQIKPVLVNLDIIIKWYLKYKNFLIFGKQKSEGEKVKPGNSEDTDSIKSIAVLPFKDMSPEKDQDYFCEGMAEEIINVLAHVENFKVIARTSAFAFKEKQVDIREIGRILDVETLLEGSVRKSGDRIRITAQLIKVTDGSHIWSERYDREMKDVFAIQDEIALAIADNLKIKLIGDKTQITAKLHSENLEAYNLYLKGTYCWQTMTAEGFNKAVEYFKEALQKDPNYASAYVGLATVIFLSSAYGGIPPDKAHPRTLEYINIALKLNNRLEAAYGLLGLINTFYHWNWKEADRNFKHSLQINPNRSMTYIIYLSSLTVSGHHEEALSMVRRAQELDPISSYSNAYTSLALVYAGQIDKAIEELKLILITDPHYYLAHFHLAWAYLSKSMYKEMCAESKIAVDLSKGNPFTIACLFLAYYKTNKIDLADKLFEGLKKRSENEYIVSTSFYLMHRVRGEEELALEWLKRACIERDVYLPWCYANPFFIPKGSKYMALVKEMGLDY